MFFYVKDVKQFQGNKEFIDTAIVPLLSLNFEESKMVQSSSETEYLMSLTSFIEKQFKGRLMVLPPFSYIEQRKSDENVLAIKEELYKAGFKHIFFITTEHFWTSKSEHIDVIWLPAIPLESMDSIVKKTVLEDQLKQVLPTFLSRWNNH